MSTPTDGEAGAPVPTDRLGVVLPTRNTRELVLACLGSLAGAEVAEIVVVDDASDDATAKAVRERFPAASVITTCAPLGFTAAVNQGAREVRNADILLLLNSDTTVDAEGVKRLRAAFAADPLLGIAGAHLVYPDGRPQWSGGPAPTLGWLLLMAAGLPSLLDRLPAYRRLHSMGGHGGRPIHWVTGAAMAVRREVWDTVGPFDEQFRFYGQDLDLCLRARAAGWRIGVVPGFRVVHHLGATIRRQRGAVAQANPELLWTDLDRWAEKHHPGTWARMARRALLSGGWLRIIGRVGIVRMIPSARRAAFRAETDRYRRAARTLLTSAPPSTPESP